MVTILSVLRYVPPVYRVRAVRWGLRPLRGISVVPARSLHFIVIQALVTLWGTYMLVAKASLLITKAFVIDKKCLL